MIIAKAISDGTNSHSDNLRSQKYKTVSGGYNYKSQDVLNID